MPNTLKPKTDPSESAIYQIRLKGHLSGEWTDWFDGLIITLEENGDTLLTGPVIDQSALHGLLRKVRDLGLPLLSVMCVEPGPATRPEGRRSKAGETMDGKEKRIQTNRSTERCEMKTLVAGANGATGRQLVHQLLERGHRVMAVVRSAGSLPERLRKHENLSVIEASFLDLSDAELTQLVDGCDAVVSCLGHNLSLKGIYGHPRRLVTNATRRLCTAIQANQPQAPVRFVLMNTTGNSNRDLDERRSFAEKLVIGLFRLVLPPQADNEQAADYLRTVIGQNDVAVEWVAVRPDSLLNEDTVTVYTVHPSPTTSPIFGSGQTSRINVGHFMADLITDDATWNKWKGQMPVIYNKNSS